MSTNEQEIVEALHRVPNDRWLQVLEFIRSLEGETNGTVTERPPIRTAADLLASPLVGMWSDRTDIEDSRAFARRLREQAEHRGGPGDVAGH